MQSSLRSLLCIFLVMNIVQENEKLKECIVAPSTTQQKQSLTLLVSQENTNVGLDKYIIISTEQSVFVRQLSCYSVLTG